MLLAARKSCASAGSSSFRGPYFLRDFSSLGIPIVGFSYEDRCYWLRGWSIDARDGRPSCWTFPDSNALLRPAQGYWLAPRFMFASHTSIFSWRTGGVFDVLGAQFFPSIFRPPVFDPRNQDLSVEFFHGAASCVARLVTCKPPICVRGACHHSAPPKARVDQGQSGTSQNRSRRWQAVGLSGQAPSIAPAIADTCAKEPVGAQFAKHGPMAVAKIVARNAGKPQHRRFFGPPPARLSPFAPARTPREENWTHPPGSKLLHLGVTAGGELVFQHCDEVLPIS